MSATLQEEQRQGTESAPFRPPGDEVSPLAPERPRRSRQETARLAAEAVRRVQRQRGWLGRVRAWLARLLGR